MEVLSGPPDLAVANGKVLTGKAKRVARGTEAAFSDREVGIVRTGDSIIPGPNITVSECEILGIPRVHTIIPTTHDDILYLRVPLIEIPGEYPEEQSPVIPVNYS